MLAPLTVAPCGPPAISLLPWYLVRLFWSAEYRLAPSARVFARGCEMPGPESRSGC